MTNLKFQISNLKSGPHRGFAILTVLGVVLVILIYLATVQGMVEMTAMQGRASARRLDVAESMASLATLAVAVMPEAGATAALKTPDGREGRATWTPLTPGDGLWKSMPVLRPLPGDELLTVELATETSGTMVRGRFIVNRQGARPVPVTLGWAVAGAK